jgi:hypothetical protein
MGSVSGFGKCRQQGCGISRLHLSPTDANFFDDRSGNAGENLGDTADASSAVHAFDVERYFAHNIYIDALIIINVACTTLTFGPQVETLESSD